ncbi:unnamed protein product, partial [Musa acuminata subsp. burmannicoides]
MEDHGCPCLLVRPQHATGVLIALPVPPSKPHQRKRYETLEGDGPRLYLREARPDPIGLFPPTPRGIWWWASAYKFAGAPRKMIVRWCFELVLVDNEREHAGGHECVLACFLSLSIIDMAPSSLLLFLWLACRKLCCKGGVRISVERSV